MTSAPTLSAGVMAGVRSWLDADDERQLLILLDEADQFLLAEAPGFPNVSRLKSLMESSGQRCKVVFAGLHNVGRFQRDPNHPFAHMGRPIGVGGLDPRDACGLVTEPLGELGFVPANMDVVLRAVTFANYHPAVLQLLGHHLTHMLQARRPASPPPWTYDAKDIDDVIFDRLADKIVQLLDLTLDLDDRYGVIAYTLAKRDREQDTPAALTTDQIVAAAKEAGVEGSFTELGRSDEVTALLDEMQHLGVLRRPKGGRYQLRSRYITNMLGTYGEIEEKLLGYVIRVNDASGSALDPTRDRGVFTEDRCRVFPLTFQQVETFCSPSSSHYAIVGSAALGIDDVENALTQVTETIPDAQVLPATTLTSRRGAGKPPRGREQIHRLVIGDLRSDQRSKIDRALDEADRWATDEALTGTICTLLLLDVRQLDVLRGLLLADQPEVKVGSRQSPGRLTPLVALRRLSQAAVRTWASNAELDLRPGEHVKTVMAHTGGWPLLLTRAARISQQSHITFADAAVQIGQQLEDPAQAAEFVSATGADGLDQVARNAWDVLVTYGGTGVEDFDEEYAQQTGSSKETARRERRLLNVLGIADIVDGRIVPEKLLTRAWDVRRG